MFFRCGSLAGVVQFERGMRLILKSNVNVTPRLRSRLVTGLLLAEGECVDP